MAQFALVALCVLATLSGSRAETPLEFGMHASTKAFKLVCWYENLKNFPETHSNGWGVCEHGVDDIIDEVLILNKDYFKTRPEEQEAFFGTRVQTRMYKIPSDYKTNCEKYLKDAKAAPATDEGDALNDGGNDYPYKAFAYCLMQTIRAKHGDGAIESIKSEKTHSTKHWMTSIFDRENEFRALHGVEPLSLSPELSKAAQVWAETNAKECKMFHSDHESRKWNGNKIGENLLSGGGADEKEIAAYQAIDAWYKEIKDYPFPEGYEAESVDDVYLEKIGHFTQSMWKGSKVVGYRYAYNKDCGDKATRYVVARYYPTGNMLGDFRKNVGPPKTNK